MGDHYTQVLNCIMPTHSCRGELYRDMTQNLSEVKQAAADSVLKVKERLRLKERDADGVIGQPGSGRSSGERGASTAAAKHDGIKAIQDENAELHKAVSSVGGKQCGGWLPGTSRQGCRGCPQV